MALHRSRFLLLAATVTVSVAVSTGTAGAQSVPTCNGVPATIVGTPSNDRIIGTAGNDVIVGLGGNDVILGGEGSDLICGGDGNDVIRGQQKADVIFAGDGNDRVFGNWGADEIHGGNGEDRIDGGFGLDTIYGGEGANYLRGGNHADELFGGSANDDIGGGNGHDVLHGLGGNDILRGGNGRDTLRGDSGNDIINSGADADIIVGGSGEDDIRTGGSVGDSIDSGEGLDIIDGIRETTGNTNNDTTATDNPDVSDTDGTSSTDADGFNPSSLTCTPDSLTNSSNPVWEGLEGSVFDLDLHLQIVNRVRDVCGQEPLDAGWEDPTDPITLNWSREIADNYVQCVADHSESACHWTAEHGDWWRHSQPGDQNDWRTAANSQFPFAGENLALRSSDRVEVFINGWIHSKGHFCSMINPMWDQLGASGSVTTPTNRYNFSTHVFRGDFTYDASNITGGCDA